MLMILNYVTRQFGYYFNFDVNKEDEDSGI